jgi:hypothetical protein
VGVESALCSGEPLSTLAASPILIPGPRFLTPSFNQFVAALGVSLALALPSAAATYYVATDGNDSNAGTNIAAPFATPQKALTASLAPGDTIYVRGGTYALAAKVSPGSSKVGAAGNPIKFWAYPGEKPVFDFNGMTTGDKGLDLRRNYWHVKGIEVRNAPDSGILVAGYGTTIEGCVVHDCGNDGFIFGSTSVRTTNALILNCDSYRNYGGGDGNNGDGFGAKAGCGPGNVFRGCRAWNNADDGWDCYDNVTNSIAFQNCWSFANGYDLWGYGSGWSGNGNGFKLGGASTYATHYVTNCVAFGNRSKGFDHNNSHGGHTIVHCTGYSNIAPNFSFFDTPGNGTRNLLINNAAFVGTATNLDLTSLQISNSWQLVTVTAADFASLDITVATNARAADYSLPTNSLFRLAPGSQLIDKGANVGLPFNGAAPDLGGFEFTAAARTPTTLVPVGRGWTNDGFRICVNGLTSHGQVLILASTNLPHWQSIHTNAPVTGELLYLDTTAANHPRRFYRAQEM